MSTKQQNGINSAINTCFYKGNLLYLFINNFNILMKMRILNTSFVFINSYIFFLWFLSKDSTGNDLSSEERALLNHFNETLKSKGEFDVTIDTYQIYTGEMPSIFSDELDNLAFKASLAKFNPPKELSSIETIRFKNQKEDAQKRYDERFSNIDTLQNKIISVYQNISNRDSNRKYVIALLTLTNDDGFKKKVLKLFY